MRFAASQRAWHGVFLKAIYTWNASERNQLFQWLNQLGFIPN